MNYQIRWDYSDIKSGETPPNPQNFDVHFVFHLLFPFIPPGESHAAHFCFNVLCPSAAIEAVIPATKRGHIIRKTFSYLEITKEVEQAVADAFSGDDHQKALEILNTRYIYNELDFSAEFKNDVEDPLIIVEKIHGAFNGAARGQGTTLHQATVMDDWGGNEDQEKARVLDGGTRWQDVLDSTISDHRYLGYLNEEGYRYYLPAVMLWAIKHRDFEHAYHSLLPVVAPRDWGQVHGDKFDVREFISRHSFTPAQVETIYSFLVFAIVEGREKVSEDYYPAMLKWRKAARGGADGGTA